MPHLEILFHHSAIENEPFGLQLPKGHRENAEAKAEGLFPK